MPADMMMDQDVDPVVDPAGAPPSDMAQSDAPSKSSIRREAGEVPEARRASVKRWTAMVQGAKKYWEEKSWKYIRQDMDFLIGIQWSGATDINNDDRYVANIVQRHVNQRVAAVYAKNPTVVAKRKPKMDFEIWDESPQSLMQAQQLLAQAATIAVDPLMPPDPAMLRPYIDAQRLMDDYNRGVQERRMYERVARTMEIYFRNKVLVDQQPDFKTQMKQLVRRTEACGAGYLKLGIVRDLEVRPETATRISTVAEQLATVERLMADMQDGEPRKDEASAEAEELRLTLEKLRSEPEMITQEGIVFDFPLTTAIIPDPKVRSLVGFVGAGWVCEEYQLTVDDVKEIWKVDVGKNYKAYCPDGEYWANYMPAVGAGRGEDGRYKKGLVCVWEIYDRKTGLMFTIADGYPDFITEPEAPPLKLEQFFPWYTLAFNQIEHPDKIYPISDVRILRGPQEEYNRSRQGLREHRHANRPMTVTEKGKLDDEDKANLQTRPANAVVSLNALGQGQKISDVMQNWEGPKIQSELYDVAPVFEDVLRSVGSQEANLGGTSGSTATESSIAEGSRMSSLQSNIDDLDDFLPAVMRAAGQVALREISKEDVVRICGRGAVWPELTGQDIAEEVYLDIVAGSSGRPNKSAEVQNFTQMAPIMLQIPGITPEFMAREGLKRMDDKFDLTDAFIAGMPSIQSMNAMSAKPLNAPSETGEDPKAQGGEGGSNVREGDQRGGGLGPQQPNDRDMAGVGMAVN